MIHMSKKSILAVLLVLVLTLLASTAMAAEGKVTTQSGLLMREEPNTTSKAVHTLGKGAKVSILYKDGNWYRVSYGKYDGFAYASYIETEDVILTKKQYENGEYILQKGDKGDLVKELQADLSKLGYYKNSCDGNFGDVTKEAVMAFQKANKMTADGVAGTSTLKKIADLLEKDEPNTDSTVSDGTLKKGSKGEAVKKLQQRLKDLGYYKSGCDSDYGSQTVAAVKSFQGKNGLEQTGVADPATQKKLYSDSAIGANTSTAPATLNTNQTLKVGSSGEQVKLLQKRLKELGYYNNSADGNFGYQTLKAVIAFQLNNGLTDDGVAGPSTLKKLVSDSANKPGEGDDNKPEEDDKLDTDGSLKKGDSGEAVKALQRRLKALGYYTNYVDGDYGSQTVAAVKAFQKKNGLTDDGVAGSVTLTKLNSSSAIGANDKTEEEEKPADDDTLKKGSKGEAVRKLQQRLKDLGYYTPGVDGDYGTQTVNAVKAFQKRNGLTDDGVAGPSTQNKLYSDSAVGAKDKVEDDLDDDGTLKKGDSGEAVKTLQRRLKELGYYTNYIDGDYGSQTVTAVKAFQKRNGLTDDGVAGPATLSKLNSSSAIGAKDPIEEEEKPEDDGSLKKGSKGEAVEKLQQRLKNLGYYTPGVDGSYGDRTVSAVKAFQKNNGLEQDGVAGKDTLDKLYSDKAINASGAASDKLNTDQTLRKGDSGAQVKALQLRLKELGYYTTTIDSDYGYRTAAAVSDFQRANGLTVDGTAGPATLRKLVSDSALTKEEAEKKEEEDNNDPTPGGDNDGKYVTESLDWFKDGEDLFVRKTTLQVKDCKTGLVFTARVLYGSNHLDAEPLTAADTEILLKINGGVEFQHYRRPMLVLYKDHVYAASIYSEPHGEQSITNNNFEGQFCLHFTGSKLHKKDENGNYKDDADHQNCVKQALNYTW